MHVRIAISFPSTPTSFGIFFLSPYAFTRPRKYAALTYVLYWYTIGILRTNVEGGRDRERKRAREKVREIDRGEEEMYGTVLSFSCTPLFSKKLSFGRRINALELFNVVSEKLSCTRRFVFPLRRVLCQNVVAH